MRNDWRKELDVLGKRERESLMKKRWEKMKRGFRMTEEGWRRGRERRER